MKTAGLIVCISRQKILLESSLMSMLSLVHFEYLFVEPESFKNTLSILERHDLPGNKVCAIICDGFLLEVDGELFFPMLHAKYPEMEKIFLNEEGLAFKFDKLGNVEKLIRNGLSSFEGISIKYAIGETLLRWENESLLPSIQKDRKSSSMDKGVSSDGLQGHKGLFSTPGDSTQFKAGEPEEVFNAFNSNPIAHRLIGNSQAIEYVLYRIEKVAPTSTTVLILGETGTGKELIAEMIHNTSKRSNKPLVKVNCAALPAELIESELFGHEKGAFTGASTQKEGKFEMANDGTLFLDEIGELPLKLQAKLLRAIESGEIERVGGSGPTKVDIRFITATNRNLELEILAGNFRKDLFFRLNVYPVTLPPLRQRKEDINLLVKHFIERFNKKIGRQIDAVSEKTMQQLMNYDWPGNVRELENIIERGMILSQSTELRIELPLLAAATPTEFLTLDEAQKSAILSALQRSNGKISGKNGAAYYLDVNASTLRAKMRKLGIEKETARFKD